jgi:hypothetical protein
MIFGLDSVLIVRNDLALATTYNLDTYLRVQACGMLVFSTQLKISGSEVGTGIQLNYV